MERQLKKILTEAKNLGACNKVDRIISWKDLLDAFFMPWGVEFMTKNDFPRIETFRMHKEKIAKRGIFVDSGELSFVNSTNVGLIGKTKATVTYYGPDALNVLVVMKGAIANVVASGHAVIKIYNIGGEVNINADKTVKIL